MWYYESNGQSVGPIGKGQISQALRSGRINQDTLVCRGGTTAWLKLVETELVTLISTSVPLLAGKISISDVSRVDRKGFTRLFWWWVGLAGFSLAVSLVAWIANDYFISTPIIFLILLPLLAASFLEFLMLYKHWANLQDGLASLKPGKAVGFLFIPFFGLYWMIRGYYGLVQEQIRFIGQHLNGSDGKRPISFITLGYLILHWLCIAFAAFLTVSTIIYNTTYYYYSSALTFYNDALSIPLLIVFLLQLFTRWAMLVDLYLTGRSILQQGESG